MALLDQFGAFETARFWVQDWRVLAGDQVQAAALLGDLRGFLTPPVLRHLPPSLAHDPHDDIAAWMTARLEESDVMAVVSRADKALTGLVFLSSEPDAKRPDFHLGYLFSERVWGQGVASEVLRSLVIAIGDAAPITLIGGVGRDNAASARVLQKAGFKKDDSLSTQDTAVYRCDLG